MTNTKNNTKPTLSLISDEQGSGFVEKIVIIGLFVFAVAGGIGLLATGANGALEKQATQIGEYSGVQ